MHVLTRLLLIFAVISCFPASNTHAFSFSEYEQGEDAGEGSPQISLATLQCPDSLKSSKIATMIGEKHRDDRRIHYGFWGNINPADNPDWDNRFGTQKSVYGSLIDGLNNGFGQLGLRTFTADEINAQIAQEEQEAFLNNDLDAAMTAADRLQADFVLKGIISTLSQTNKAVNIEEVFVTINLTLYSRDGKQISSAQVSETVFSDADIQSTIQKIVNKQADLITYRLFEKYCK